MSARLQQRHSRRSDGDECELVSVHWADGEDRAGVLGEVEQVVEGSQGVTAGQGEFTTGRMFIFHVP